MLIHIHKWFQTSKKDPAYFRKNNLPSDMAFIYDDLLWETCACGSWRVTPKGLKPVEVEYDQSGN